MLSETGPTKVVVILNGTKWSEESHLCIVRSFAPLRMTFLNFGSSVWILSRFWIPLGSGILRGGI